jgi:predicted kinase
MKKGRIILTVGIPASGKSTWSKRFVKSNKGWVRVCRDDYRLMLADAQMMSGKGERLVTRLVKNAIEEAVNLGFNVIVDQTNVNLKRLRPMVMSCKHIAVTNVEVFHISLEDAIERDKNREASVGSEVIKRMYANYEELIESGYLETI